MRSPLIALSWEIFRRGRLAGIFSLACVALCTLLNLIVPQNLIATATGEQIVDGIFGMLMFASFTLLIGIFNYTEYSSSREWNGFPYRLFTLPVRTWQLVALPMFLGLASVELLFLAWIKLVWSHDPIPTPGWFALVLGAFLLFYQIVLWCLAGFRILRIVVLSLGGVSGVGVAFLPKSYEIFPSPWLAENRLVPAITAVMGVMLLIALGGVARQRCGGGLRRNWFTWLLERLSDTLPHRRANFSSPAAAQFWFEWRRSGLLLPTCTAFVLLAIFAPYSWFYRHHPDTASSVLIRILAVPPILSLVIGQFFSRPDLWTASLALPSFFATRPLPSGDFVICKMKVAALSVALTWLLVFGFLALWLPFWADTTQFNEPFYTLRHLIYPHSWWIIIAVILAGLVILSWRFIVNGLWAGLSGKDRWCVSYWIVQITVPLFLLIAAAIFSNKIDALIRDHSPRTTSTIVSVVGWLLALLLVARVWCAVFFWSKIHPCRTRQYLLIWSAVTAVFIALGASYPPWADTYRLTHLFVLAALLLFPLARLGFALLCLSRNRHR